MSDDKTSDVSRDLIATLEACAERLQGIRKEAELGLTLLDMAIETVSRVRALPSSTDVLRDLLKAHHDRLAQTILSGRQPEGMTAEPSFGFRMDPQQRVARIGRRRIPLTPSEYQVLELLWEQMPSPVSRKALLDRLYGGQHETTESVIDMFIFKIRQKLRNAGCTDASIKGIRGLGWVLDLGEPSDVHTQLNEMDEQS